MNRFLSLAALAVFAAAPSAAQSDLSTSSTALAVSGSYVGAVSRSSGYGLDEMRAPRVSLDVTYGRVSGGVGLSFFQYETAVDGALGFHIARDRARQLTTTLVMSAQGNEGGGSLLAFSMGHGRRVYQNRVVTLVPGASVGLGLVRGGPRQDPAVLFASTGLSVMAGQGSTRGVLTPTVAVSTGPEQVVSLGVSAGLVQSLGR